MKHLIIFIILLTILSWTSIYGQTSNTFQVLEHSPIHHNHEQCLTDYKRALNFQKHPELIEKRRQIQAASTQWIKDNEHRLMNRSSNAVVNIPVVVHVVYANATQNISDAQINTQIQVLNEDFSLTNSNFNSSVPAVFQSLAADCEISFCLAQVDPLGAVTTGITRTATTITNVGHVDSNSYLFNNATGGHDAWDETRYLNIWVCEILDVGGFFGYATSPGDALPGEDGVVIDYKYFGTIGTAANSAPMDKGRTATHEVGHYFNLHHIWGPNGGCSDDDGVSDTPMQESSNQGFPTHPSSSCSSDDMFMNYMDYTDDACMAMFSMGQKTRMLAAINGPRIGLINNSSACGASPVRLLENNLDLTIFPNPVNNNTVRIAINTNSINKAQMRIMDITGRTQVQGRINEYADIDVSALNAGVYFVEVIQDQKRSVQKLVIH